MRRIKKQQMDRYQWHRWFAWFPVDVESEHLIERVWWEDVERRMVGARGGDYWEYRDLTN